MLSIEMDPTRADRVARAILEKYASLNVKADGWTVVAGIACVAPDNHVCVLAVASGCKCVGKLEKRDDVVRDGHAEVVARRALRRALLDDADVYNLATEGECWLFATAPPCGDAAIYALDDDSVAFSGAKLGDWRREDAQVTSAVRLKPGRSDVPVERRSGSLSCSDKILKWSVCGLQGALLRAKFPGAMPLAGVVVSSQPRSSSNALVASLDRALFLRAEHLAAACRARPPLLRTRVTDVGAELAAQRGAGKPSSLIVAWWRGCGAPEILIAATGRPRGATKTSTAVPRLATTAFLAALGVSNRAAHVAAAPRRALDVTVRAVLRADLAKRSTHTQLPASCLLVPEGVDECRVPLDDD